jgi:hypothetical protein
MSSRFSRRRLVVVDIRLQGPWVAQRNNANDRVLDFTESLENFSLRDQGH